MILPGVLLSPLAPPVDLPETAVPLDEDPLVLLGLTWCPLEDEELLDGAALAEDQELLDEVQLGPAWCPLDDEELLEDEELLDDEPTLLFRA